jgi:predicted membrane protein
LIHLPTKNFHLPPLPFGLSDLPFRTQNTHHTFGQNSNEMERTDIPKDTYKKDDYMPSNNRGSGRVVVGLLFIVGGGAWLVNRMGYDIIPHWFFTWPMILIAIGLINGVKHSFRNPGAYIMLLIGGAFLVRNNFDIPYEFKMYFWPIILMMIGLFIIFKPRNRKKKCSTRHGVKHDDDTTIFGAREGQIHDNSIIESVVIFGGTQKDVISKTFEGGEITTVFGGTEINFGKADIVDVAEINFTTVFGGIKLTVPPHWDVVIKTTNIAGGIDDKRRKDGPSGEKTKTLILSGSIIFGGIDIRSSANY